MLPVENPESRGEISASGCFGRREESLLVCEARVEGASFSAIVARVSPPRTPGLEAENLREEEVTEDCVGDGELSWIDFVCSGESFWKVDDIFRLMAPSSGVEFLFLSFSTASSVALLAFISAMRCSCSMAMPSLAFNASTNPSPPSSGEERVRLALRGCNGGGSKLSPML